MRNESNGGFSIIKGFKQNLQHCSDTKRTNKCKCFSLYCRIELTICHKKTVGDSYKAIGVTTNRCNEISFTRFWLQMERSKCPEQHEKNSRSVKPVWKGFPSLVMAKSCYTWNGPIVCHKKKCKQYCFWEMIWKPIHDSWTFSKRFVFCRKA